MDKDDRVLCTAFDDTVRVVPVAEWGRDHWSTLLYIESRCVDYKGVLDNRHMRCNSRRHRKFTHSGGWSGRYSSRVREGVVSGHDDWDCLEDMACAGLFTFDCVDLAEDMPFEGGQVTVTFTALGGALAADLRMHKANGKPDALFEQSRIDLTTDAA